MTPLDQAPDEELLARLTSGDTDALQALVGRFLPHLYDLALRITLDSASASEAVTSVFAGIGASAGPDGAGLTPYAWLLGMTRDQALARTRRLGENAEGGLEDERYSRLPEDHPAAVDPQLGALAWSAARLERPRDYALLDLSIRRGLTPEEIADTGGVSRGAVYAAIGRVRGSFEESFTAAVLFHRARDACEALQAVCGDAEDLTPALRRDVSRHAQSCPECRRARAAFALPADLFAAFFLIEPGSDLAEQILAAAGPSLQAALPLAGAGIAEAAAENGAGEPDAVVADSTGAGEWIGASTPDGGGQDIGLPEDESAVVESTAFAFEPRLPVSIPTPEPPGPPGLGDGKYLGGSEPPRPPWQTLIDWFNEERPARFFLVVLLVGLTVLAGYLGLAIGSSIRDGGNETKNVSLPVLPTPVPGVREASCGSGPIAVDVGFRTTLNFDTRSLSGQTISELKLRPDSIGANERMVMVRAQQNNSVLFEALGTSGAGVSDQYKLAVTFTHGKDATVSECTVIVRAPTATPTPTETITPTATPTRTPVRTQPQPTSPPPQPTATVELPTPTIVPAITNTPLPTATQTLTPAATSTNTPVPPTPTRTRTATPTP